MKFKISENLRAWFGTGGKGGVGGGGWDRYNTTGERLGQCAREPGEGKPKCLSKEKAARLRSKGGKKAIASAVVRKKRADPVADRAGKGNKPKMVSSEVKRKVNESDSTMKKDKKITKLHGKKFPKGTHKCATHVEHAKFGYGRTITSKHAAPNENGDIDWYDVMFEHGIEKGIPTKDMKIHIYEMHEDHDHHNEYHNDIMQETRMVQHGDGAYVKRTDGEKVKTVTFDKSQAKRFSKSIAKRIANKPKFRLDFQPDGSAKKTPLKGTKSGRVVREDIAPNVQKHRGTSKPVEYDTKRGGRKGVDFRRLAKKAKKGASIASITKESVEVIKEACWKGYEQKGMKTMFGKRYPNCVKKTKNESVDTDLSEVLDTPEKAYKYMAKSGDKQREREREHGKVRDKYRKGETSRDELQKSSKDMVRKNRKAQTGRQRAWRKTYPVGSIYNPPKKHGPKNESVETISEAEKDACYHKVKARYDVWPSAYASGALVKCRKVGAKNWGNKGSKNEETELDKAILDSFFAEEHDSGKMDPKSHVKKEGPDKFCVYHENGKKVKTFDNKKDAEAYAVKNHDDLMNKKKKEVSEQDCGCNKIDDRVVEAVAAWQRSAGKNKEGGLNEKGRKSYERENPGSDLKAPVSAEQAKKSKGGKAAKRRKSFCARMGGMKGPMKDEKGRPTRKALALRKWDC